MTYSRAERRRKLHTKTPMLNENQTIVLLGKEKKPVAVNRAFIRQSLRHSRSQDKALTSRYQDIAARKLKRLAKERRKANRSQP